MWSTQYLGPQSQPFDGVIMQIRGLQDIRSQAIIKCYHLSWIIGSASSSVIRDCAGLGRRVHSLIKQMAQKFTIQELQLMVSSMLFPLGVSIVVSIYFFIVLIEKSHHVILLFPRNTFGCHSPVT